MLLEFYGTECGHCLTMSPLVARLEKEFGISVTKYETWHNEANEAKRMQFDRGRCGGVPFFMNTETDATICGVASYDELKLWAGVSG